ncbi:hypothetical protein EAI_01827 [Harpegnathos saltator]|uniref:Uncharacterized protein n=1 Tax=Harpegnathos saltator TaxID=610380 RepID=E2B7C2_HARSA|nr:hypothetical protein EAI_01827 [Harpegnathos saltator]
MTIITIPFISTPSGYPKEWLLREVESETVSPSGMAKVSRGVSRYLLTGRTGGKKCTINYAKIRVNSLQHSKNFLSSAIPPQTPPFSTRNIAVRILRQDSSVQRRDHVKYKIEIGLCDIENRTAAGRRTLNSYTIIGLSHSEQSDNRVADRKIVPHRSFRANMLENNRHDM